MLEILLILKLVTGDGGGDIELKSFKHSKFNKKEAMASCEKTKQAFLKLNTGRYLHIDASCIDISYK